MPGPVASPAKTGQRYPTGSRRPTLQNSPSLGQLKGGPPSPSPKAIKRNAGDSCSVRVLVRIRPFNQREIEAENGSPTSCIECHSDTLVSTNHSVKNHLNNLLEQREDFGFDGVFWSIPKSQCKNNVVPFSGQQQVFENVGLPILDSTINGYNSCILAYGQTGSGKSHTMMGTEMELGFIPRLCEELFTMISTDEDKSKDLESSNDHQRKVKYKVDISYMEIYNEKIRDLLTEKRQQRKGPDPKAADGPKLEVHFDPKVGPYVKGLSAIQVAHWEDVQSLLRIGDGNRSTGATEMNAESSRSHAIVQVSLHQEETMGLVGGKAIQRSRRSRINLVDLAGSEKVERSKVEGAMLTEAININKSLTVLGRVIDLLIKKESHIPYRDSVLTYALSDSLGGNSKTTMIATLSPSISQFDESVSTLRYAVRARKIVNTVKVNEDASASLIRELQEELSRLRQAMADGNGDAIPRGSVTETEAMIEALRDRELQDAMETQKRAKQWQEETSRIESKHQLEMESLAAKARAEREHLQGQLSAAQKREDDAIQMIRRERTNTRLHHDHSAKLLKQKDAQISVLDRFTKTLQNQLQERESRDKQMKAMLSTHCGGEMSQGVVNVRVLQGISMSKEHPLAVELCIPGEGGERCQTSFKRGDENPVWAENFNLMVALRSNTVCETLVEDVLQVKLCRSGQDQGLETLATAHVNLNKLRMGETKHHVVAFSETVRLFLDLQADFSAVGLPMPLVYLRDSSSCVSLIECAATLGQEVTKCKKQLQKFKELLAVREEETQLVTNEMSLLAGQFQSIKKDMEHSTSANGMELEAQNDRIHELLGQCEEVQQELEAQRNTNRDMAQELENVRTTRHEDELEQMRALTSRVTELQSSLSQQQDVNRELISENRDVKDGLVGKEERLKQTQQALQEEREGHDETDRELANAVSNLDEVKQLNKGLKKELEHEQELTGQYRKQVLDLGRELDEAKLQLEEAMAQLEHLRKDLETDLSNTQDSLQDTNREKEAMKLQFEQERKRMQNDIFKADAELSTLKEALVQKEGEMASKVDQFHQMRTDYATSSKEVEEVQKELTEALNTTRAALKESKITIKELDAECDRLRNDDQKNQATIRNLEEECVRLQNEQQTTVFKLEQEKESMRSEISTIGAKCVLLEEAHKSIEEQCEKLRKELQMSSSACVSLGNTLEVKELELNKSVGECRQIESDHQDAVSSYRKLQQEMDATVSTLETKCATLLEQEEKLKIALANEVQRVQKLQGRLETIGQEMEIYTASQKQEHQEAQTELQSNLQRKLEDARNEWKTNITNMTQEHHETQTALQSKLQNEVLKSQALEAQISESQRLLEHNKEEMEVYIANQAQNHQRAQAALRSELQGKVDDTVHEMETSMARQTQEYQKAQTALLSELQQMEQQFLAAKDRVQVLEALIARLESDQEEATARYKKLHQEMNATLSALQMKHDKLLKDHEELRTRLAAEAQKAQALGAQVDDLHKQLEDSTVQAQEQRTAKTQLQCSLQETEQLLQDEKALGQALNSQLIWVTSEVKVKTEALVFMEKSLEEAGRDASNRMEELQNKQAKAEADLAEKSIEMSDLIAECKEAKYSAAKYQKESESLKQMLAKCEGVISILETDIAQYEAKQERISEAVQTELTACKEQLRAKEKEFKILEAERETALQQRQAIEAEQKWWQEVMMEKDQALARVRMDHEATRNAWRSSEERWDLLRQELEPEQRLDTSELRQENKELQYLRAAVSDREDLVREMETRLKIEEASRTKAESRLIAVFERMQNQAQEASELELQSLDAHIQSSRLRNYNHDLIAEYDERISHMRQDFSMKLRVVEDQLQCVLAQLW